MNVLSQANKVIERKVLNGDNEPFYILNLEDVKHKYFQWMEKIPRVQPFYAVKCNDDIRVLKLLSDLGAGFDCASKNEFLKVLSLKVSPERIIYAHTVKYPSHLRTAAEKEIKKMTFDCEAELMKIKIHHPAAKVVLRIRFDAVSTNDNLGLKFGCNPVTEAPRLIKLCLETNMNLIGIAFHVGSATMDFSVYERALETVRQLFDFAECLGMKLNFVDIGGGFIGADPLLFDNYAKFINAGIDKYFPAQEVKFISEPGRYFVDTAFSLLAEVILKKSTEDGQVAYYINESVFMSFIESSLYGGGLEFSTIRKSNFEKEPKEKLSTVWGCTCTSMDKIIADRMIPEMEIGDWMLFHIMGAYTTTMSTSFNGFSNLNVFTMEDIDGM